MPLRAIWPWLACLLGGLSGCADDENAAEASTTGEKSVDDGDLRGREASRVTWEGGTVAGRRYGRTDVVRGGALVCPVR